MLVDLLINACLGLLFALCAGERLRLDGVLPRPAIWLVTMFCIAIRVPLTLYLYFIHPDWSWHYMVDASDMHGAMIAAVLGAQVGAFALMWLVGAVFMQKEKPRVVAGILAATVVGTAVAVLALSERLTRYGSYEAYTEQFALGIMEVKLGYVLIVWALGTLAATTFVSMELRRDARRARSM